METYEQIIRLIVDHNEKKVGPSIGIPIERARQICDDLIDMYKRNPKVSQSLQEITATYRKQGELAYALFTFGEISTKAACPLHNGGGGMIGLLLGGLKPPDGPADDDDDKSGWYPPK